MKQFKIYQLPVEHKAKFMSFGFVTKHNIMPKLEEYKMVYEGEMNNNPVSDTWGSVEWLNTIFRKFNVAHPEGFKGHSLSVSDVVEIDGKYYYCDSYGWVEVFAQPKNEPKKAYIVKAYGSCTYKAKFNTREEALAEANKLNDEYFEHKIWNVEEIIDEDAPQEEIDREENGTRCAGETPAMKVELAEARRRKQYTEFKAKNPNALLLFRCGDFYETYFDDARTASKVLGITLTYNHHFDTMIGHEMAGFPHHALDVYLPKLIRAGYKCAIIEDL